MNQLVIGRAGVSTHRRCIMPFLNLALKLTLFSAVTFSRGHRAQDHEVVRGEHEECLSNQWAVELHPGTSSSATASLVADRNGLLLQENGYEITSRGAKLLWGIMSWANLGTKSALLAYTFCAALCPVAKARKGTLLRLLTEPLKQEI